MLTFSRSLIDTGPPDVFTQQRDDFIELLTTCLKYNWQLARQPTEEDYVEYILRGKAPGLLEKKWSDDITTYHHVLHLVRGYREHCALNYDICRYRHKGWAAWLEIKQGIPTYIKKRNV